MTPQLMKRRLYRSVFGSPEGQRVLAHMLQDMKFFADNLTDPCDVAVANYGKTILRNCGIFPDRLDKAPRMELIVQHLMEIPDEEENRD